MINPAELSQFMENQLNKNTVGIKFKTYYWLKNFDRTDRISKTDNTSYIYSMLSNHVGSFRPIPGITISDQEFVLNIYVPQEQQNEVMLAIEEISTNLIALKANVGGVDCVFNLDVPTLAGVNTQNLLDFFQQDGRFIFSKTQNYAVIQLKVYFTTGKDLLFGNDVQYFLNNEPLKRIDSSIFNKKITHSEQVHGKGYIENINTQNSSPRSVTFYLLNNSELCKTIIKDFENEENMNRIYQLQTVYNNDPEMTFTKNVIISSGSVDVSLGSAIKITCEFLTASSVLGDYNGT